MQSSGPHLHADFPSDERDQRSYLAWMQLWLAHCNRALQDGAPVMLFTEWRQLLLTPDALQCACLTWRGGTDKADDARPQRGSFSNQAKHVIQGSKDGMPLGLAAPSLPGVFREAIRKADKHHLTGKPTDLMRKLVRICEQGGRILYPFVGSGTSLVAADAEGYSWTGIEMTGCYFEVAGPRLSTP
ncbi:DNA methyltransferase [Stenotrophomonas maltophilia]|uniref:DNA methyltransferase n=1 Tax=Stenotrophomonas maltophilia TaxID=40324 RepID=UPI00332A699B